MSSRSPTMFQTWKVPQLREYLMLRGVPCSDASKAQLLELCVFAEKLGLQPDKTAVETAAEIALERYKILL